MSGWPIVSCPLLVPRVSVRAATIARTGPVLDDPDLDQFWGPQMGPQIWPRAEKLFGCSV